MLAGFIRLITGFPLVLSALPLSILSNGLVNASVLILRLSAIKDPSPFVGS